jgi:FkbM family methyltransferase
LHERRATPASEREKMTAEGNVDLIVHETFFRGQKHGNLVEVGAARPDFLSIGASYRSRGWNVIAIEPNPQFCAAHRALGHKIFQYACSDENADNVQFFVADWHGHEYLGGEVSFESFSSLGVRGEYAAMLTNIKGPKPDLTTIRVQVRRLDTILAQHAPDVKDIDILAVDVEGWELNVMRGLDIPKYRPKVVILENLFDDAGYVSFMKDSGYFLWRQLKPNDVYVRSSFAPITAFCARVSDWLKPASKSPPFLLARRIVRRLRRTITRG